MTLNVDRQPSIASRLEVIVDGASICNGLVSVSGLTSSVSTLIVADCPNKYAVQIENGMQKLVQSWLNAKTWIVQDRSTSDKWKLSAENGIFKIVSSTEEVQEEPVFNDVGDTSLYQRLFVQNGMTGVEQLSLVTEQYSFIDDDKVVGTNEFTLITSDGITMSGISGGTVAIRSVNSMGQPINQEKTVQNFMKVRFFAEDGRVRALKSGDDKIANHRIMAEPDADITEMDLVYGLTHIFGLTLGQVVFAEKILDFDGVTHHTEAEVMQL